MNYLKIYANIIIRAEKRNEIFGYSEKHHVFPKCVYGDNDIIVNLTAKEHLLAHYLLFKAFNKEYGLCRETKKLGHAYRMMTFVSCNTKRNPTLTQLAWARELNSIMSSGDNNPAKSEEVRKR